MRRHVFLALLVFALLLAPTVASAAWTVVFDTSSVPLQVGRTTEVGVHIEWRSGFSYFPFPPSTFTSTDSRIAIVNGDLSGTTGRGTVTITAVTPGTAFVRRIGDRWAVIDAQLAIDVVCGPPQPVRLEKDTLWTKVGEPVTLTAIADRMQDTQLLWYTGRIGDRSKPLGLSSAQVTFTPTVAGKHYVWVSAIGACTNTSAEARIEAVIPRRRAVR
jgi:hypothetical protein